MIDAFKKYTEEINSVDIRTIPPLTLAYIGDSVMDLFVRSYFATTTHEQVQQINNRAVKIVNAASQARLLTVLDEMLTDDEKDIVRRGRNAKSATKPKHADVTDYRHATGLEALLGYLFVTGQSDRLSEILGIMKVNFIEASEKIKNS